MYALGMNYPQTPLTWDRGQAYTSPNQNGLSDGGTLAGESESNQFVDSVSETGTRLVVYGPVSAFISFTFI